MVRSEKPRYTIHRRTAVGEKVNALRYAKIKIDHTLIHRGEGEGEDKDTSKKWDHGSQKHE